MTPVEPSMHETAPVRVYRKGGVTAVPHYTAQNTYVLPGGVCVKEAYLAERWVPSIAFLWPRVWCKSV